MATLTIRTKGGPTSGNYAPTHNGRPGLVGGSKTVGVPSGRSGSPYHGGKPKDETPKVEAPKNGWYDDGDVFHRYIDGKLISTVPSSNFKNMGYSIVNGELVQGQPTEPKVVKPKTDTSSRVPHQLTQDELGLLLGMEDTDDVRVSDILNDPNKLATDYSTPAEVAKANITTKLAEEAGVTVKQANAFVKQWAMSSNDTDINSLTMQQSAAKELGLELSTWQKRKLAETEKEGGTPALTELEQRKLARAMYENTQEYLRSKGFDEGDSIILYRGIRPAKTLPSNEGDIINTYKSKLGNSAESWTAKLDVARDFASGGFTDEGGWNATGYVLAARVPIKNILSTFMTGWGCMNEAEFVIAGNIPGSTAGVAILIPPPGSGENY